MKSATLIFASLIGLLCDKVMADSLFSDTVKNENVDRMLQNAQEVLNCDIFNIPEDQRSFPIEAYCYLASHSVAYNTYGYVKFE